MPDRKEEGEANFTSLFPGICYMECVFVLEKHVAGNVLRNACWMGGRWCDNPDDKMKTPVWIVVGSW